MKHLVIVRTGASVLDLKTYNCQELGLAKALTKKGLRVSLVMAGYEKKEEVYSCTNGEVSVHYLPFKAIDQRYGYFFGIDYELSSLNPDILQVHDLGVFMTWYVTKWARAHSVPCYLIQGTYQISPRFGIRLLERLYYGIFAKSVLRNVAGIGCKTRMASRFIKRFMSCETMMTYIGLDESKFSNPVDKNWRKELCIERKKILLYIGSMESRRRPLFLIDIIKTLPNDYVLILVGKGAQFDDVQKKVLSDGLQEKVFVLGKLDQEQLPSLYNQSDLFLLSSEYEIYGMVILESMYFGLPVISSYTAGSETLISQYNDGVIINDFKIGLWKNEIMQLCENQEQLMKMKFEAKNKIQNMFLWGKAADSFIKLYDIGKRQNNINKVVNG